MHWFSLNWLDILINIVVLSILPGLMAGLGGHLAAEAVSDSVRRRKIKAYFWGLFGFFVIFTAWQQLRLAEADLESKTANAWQQAFLVRTLFRPSSPPTIAYLKFAANPRVSVQQSIQQSISAPNGIAIGGQAKVQNPVVNNYGEVKSVRVLTTDQSDNLVRLASIYHADVKVLANSGDAEAYNLAQQIYVALGRAGWKMESQVGSIMPIGPPQYGVHIAYNGVASGVPDTKVMIPVDTPQLAVFLGLEQASLALFVNPSPSLPDGSVSIVVYPAPPTKE